MDKIKKVSVGVGVATVAFVSGAVINPDLSLDVPTAQARTVHINKLDNGLDDIKVLGLQEVVEYSGTNEDLDRELEMVAEEKAMCLTQYGEREAKLKDIKAEYEANK